MSAKVQELISDFNIIFKDMANYISVICPTSIIGRNIKDINGAFDRLSPANKSKFINGFVIKVLKYKEYIDAENEKYFFQEIEKDEIKNNKEFKNNDINLYELKTLWCDMSQENKDTIFQCLKSLCAICAEYILLV